MSLLPFLRELEHLTAPWQSAFSNSKVISTSVTGAHIFALFVGGGFAIAADRSTLRALRSDPTERTRQLRELDAVHRPVLIAIAVLFASGVLLALSDVKTFATAPTFWIKMALVLLLVVNGGLLTKTEQALRRAGTLVDAATHGLWKRMHVITWASLFLWSATLIAGVVLQNAT
ncbi:MAG: hypothetical protein H0U66_15515 [Gemmatimonadaceae bacterium]|nr:hypothetical protein [Gemmatimonadaceae bacterium]